MRVPALISAALAAGAFASPVKRAVVTDISYVTVTIYVTPGQEVAASTPAPEEPAPPAPKTTTSTVVYVAPSSSPVYVAPAPSSVVVSSATPAPVASEPATSVVSAASAPSATGYEATILYHHNVHRANHSASDLVWNQTLANAAQQLAETCVFQHNVDLGGGGYGQNLAASAPNANVSAQLTEGWYNGEEPNFAPYYGIASPNVDTKTFDSYGHFTQMVWKGSESTGCYTKDCTNVNTPNSIKMWYTVCNYYPPGNWAGEYAENVGKPLGDVTVHWDS